MPIDANHYRVEPLGKHHERDVFTCGSAALDRYLRSQARQDFDKRVAAPFVLAEHPGTRILGYYTLSASVVNVLELPEALVKKLPRYPQLPVTLLGRLAIDQSQKGKGLGQFLLMDALYRCLIAANTIAAMAVVVDAKDNDAEAFYRHFGFLPLQQQPQRLFLPMNTISDLFNG